MATNPRGLVYGKVPRSRETDHPQEDLHALLRQQLHEGFPLPQVRLQGPPPQGPRVPRRLILVIQPTGPQAPPAGEPGGTTRRYEAQFLHKDGGAVPVLGSSCPLFAASNREGLLLAFTDLRNGDHHQDRIERPEETACESRRVSSVIHELKNSLAILTLQSRLLSARNPLHADPGESLGIIQDQVKSMAHMLDSLRSSADPLEPHLETTDVNGLIRHTLDLYRQE